MFRFMTVWILIMGLPAVMLDNDKDGLTALCRVNCLHKLFVPGMDINCLGNWDCCSCWYWCYRLFSNFDVYGRLCVKHQLRGCREAFEFHLLHVGDIYWQHENPVQTLKHHYQPDLDIIRFEWSLPDTHESWQAEPLVYAIHVQDQQSRDWRTIEQTFFTNATISRNVLGNFSRLRLVTYFSEGVVGDIEQSYEKFNFAYSRGQRRPEKTIAGRNSSRSGHQRSEQILLPSSDIQHQATGDWVPFVHSLKYSNVYNSIDATVNWTMPLHETELEYEIEWQHSRDTGIETGRLYTWKTFAKILLLPDTVYNVTIRALFRTPSGSRMFVAQSAPLLIDAVAEEHKVRQHRFIDCTIYFPIFLITIVMTMIIIAIMLIGHIRYCWSSR